VIVAPVSNFSVVIFPLVPAFGKVSSVELEPVRVPQIQVRSPAARLESRAFQVAGVMAVCPLQAVPPLKVPAL
jgi:hypothetical protein